MSDAIVDEKEHDMMVMMLKDKYDNISQGMFPKQHETKEVHFLASNRANSDLEEPSRK